MINSAEQIYFSVSAKFVGVKTAVSVMGPRRQFSWACEPQPALQDSWQLWRSGHKYVMRARRPNPQNILASADVSIAAGHYGPRLSSLVPRRAPNKSLYIKNYGRGSQLLSDGCTALFDSRHYISLFHSTIHAAPIQYLNARTTMPTAH